MNSDAPCYEQKFGHDFPYTGADCLNCGVSQAVLSGHAPERIKDRIDFSAPQMPAQPVRGMHSSLHALVADARKQFGETAKKGPGSFGFYLGFFKRVPEEVIYRLLSESREREEPKKYFWYHLGIMSRNPKKPQE